MILSQSCEYGIRAIIYIAGRGHSDFISIGEISGKLDISFHFLTKILQKLTQNQILESHRGPNGGVRLAKSGKDISVMDIVLSIDGNKLFTHCVLGLSYCTDAHPCPFHEKWIRHRRELSEEFRQLSIADLVCDTRKAGLRI